ncbi:MAG: hypothetical protein FWC79_08205 [Oscillospiraceae bacterium]|nr:hypothetical protein [Oscillospiraceae bacterium]
MEHYGYNNSEEILNEFVHELYNSPIVEIARSMNFEDIESITGRTGKLRYEDMSTRVFSRTSI